MNHIVSGVELSSPMLVMSFCSSYFTSDEAKCHYKLSNPINCQFWHHSCIRLKELPQDMVSYPYNIFRNQLDIKCFLFLLTFSYHWETLYELHCWQCWVKFTLAGHVILQLVLYKWWSKMSLQAFQPYKLPILTSQLHPAQELPPKNGVTPLPYLEKSVRY